MDRERLLDQVIEQQRQVLGRVVEVEVEEVGDRLPVLALLRVR